MVVTVKVSAEEVAEIVKAHLEEKFKNVGDLRTVMTTVTTGGQMDERLIDIFDGFECNLEA